MTISNPLLDFAIGMIAFLLTASLLVTVLQESIAQGFDLRSNDLRKKVGNMFNGLHGDATKDFYEHPLVMALNNRGEKGGPSYIPRDVFTKVTKDLFLAGHAGAAVLDAARSLDDGLPIKSALRTLATQSKDDLAAFDKAVGDWFDGVMDRLSGLYKRRVQLILFVLGFVVAVLANLDALKVGAFLANTPAAREEVATSIRDRINAIPTASALDDAGRQRLMTDVQGFLKKTEVPMGWTSQDVRSWLWPSIWTRLKEDPLGALAGWLLTALATTLGATFWFDTLKRFVNIRAAGPIRKSAA